MSFNSLFLMIAVGLYASTICAQSFVPETSARRRNVQRPQKATAPAPQQVSQSNAWNKMDAWSFQFGTHTEFFDNVQTDASGTTNNFDFAPTIGLGMKFSFSPAWKLLPEVNWVLPYDATDSNMITNLFMLRGDVGYELLDSLRLRIGTSLMWQNMHGKGGKASVSNGTGKSTFYNPDENRSSLNNTFDLGVEGFFTKEWSARFQTYTYSLFKEETRQISYTLFLAYYWE